MKRVWNVVVLSFIFALVLSEVCYADNPVVQSIYTADPAPMVYDEKVYLYTGHDQNTATTNYKMLDWRCYSSTDMVNWTDNGSVLDVTAFKWARQDQDANAAQVIYRNGKFYYYVAVSCTLAGKGGIGIGVAVSDSPTGPFLDAIGKPLITNDMTTYASHSWDDLDPTVFIDDDGQAYLYWGNNACYYAKLNNDMISLKGSISAVSLTKEAFGPDYEEAPWIYKRNGLYYLIYASGFPECIAYSTSTSPTGPWTYRGIVMPKQGSCSTNHSGVIDYKGNSYFFYHDASLPGGGNYKRCARIEKFTYNADGTIPTFNMTSGGVVKGVSNLNPYLQTEAETICWESGVATEKCSEGGMDVENIENGDWIKVEGVDFSSGAVSFDARVASATNGGKIELRLDSSTGTLIGTCGVQGTGGGQNWTTKSCNITGATGVHDLYLQFTGGSGNLFNINWWKFNVATPKIKFGDLDGNGDVNAIDFALMKQYLLGSITKFPSADGAAAADLDTSGKIDPLDFVLMKKYLLGLITMFPADA
jgi:hypothetical protein